MKRGRKPIQKAGTQGLKGEKVARERLMRAVHRRIEQADGSKPKVLDMIVNQLVNQAMSGEAWAIREVIDRLDGKPVASVESKQEASGTVEYVFKWGGEALEAPKNGLSDMVDVTPESDA